LEGDRTAIQKQLQETARSAAKVMRNAGDEWNISLLYDNGSTSAANALLGKRE
jgi:hypothetical protein